jgi:hypothetical protein
MFEPTIYIPFPRTLYDDIVRFSDGRIRPDVLAADQVKAWISSSVEFGFGEDWGERIEEVAEKYAPHVYEKWQVEDGAVSNDARVNTLPLVWKEVTVPAGSEVRMAYGNGHHYAQVKRGKIVDEDGSYSPSEWASKVAGGTSRNAWRDLWFREPRSKTWIPAQLLRDQARRRAE